MPQTHPTLPQVSRKLFVLFNVTSRPTRFPQARRRTATQMELLYASSGGDLSCESQMTGDLYGPLPALVERLNAPGPTADPKQIISLSAPMATPAAV